MMQWIYLDNNATTKPSTQVVTQMNEAFCDHWANPSSVHRLGQKAKQQVELARMAVAKLVGCKSRDLLFTSGGTESNNLALHGILDWPSPKKVLITTNIEHAAIREPSIFLSKQQVELVYLPLDKNGLVLPHVLEQALQAHCGDDVLVLVSIQWANNETGTIQPIASLAKVVVKWRLEHQSKVQFHVDGSQAVGKIPVLLGALEIDLLTFSAHKFHGPKGVGALYVRRGIKLRPQQLGGSQERELRGGTENTAGIIGFGVAAELARQFLANPQAIRVLQARRDRFEQAILKRLSYAVVNAPGSPPVPGSHPENVLANSPPESGESGLAFGLRLWNTTNLGFPRLEAEAILIGLSERGLCASAGAACSSGSLEPSPVLLALGIEPKIAHGSIRFSLSRDTTDDEMDRAIEIVEQVVSKLARTLPLGTI